MSIRIQVVEINRLSDSVRRHINTHRYQSVLLDNSEIWNQICSSLDVIGDSLYAVESYAAAEFPSDTGLKYIYTYGILQALFLMQDALRHLSEAFKIPYEFTEALKEIRAARNASIGHPTKQDEKKIRYYNFISRFSMAKSGFELLRSTVHGKHSFTHVDISKACLNQLQEIIQAYEKIVQRLEEIDQMHKEKFAEQPLSNIFHSAMDYFFEKISQGINSSSFGDREFGQRNVGLVKQTYEKFKTALAERNELHEYTDFDLNEYFHALDKLDVYLSGGASSLKEVDARIYLSYLNHRHDHFVQIAKEIDEEYKKNASS